MDKTQYSVSAITNKEAYPFLLEIHYAKRIPSISYTFGLFLDTELVGVICYGIPPSATVRTVVAGKEMLSSILELNRLCLKNNLKNEASFLVSKSLKMLPKNKIVISYADSAQGHTGIVYQACNFKYYGLSEKRTDWALKSKPNLHGQTIADMSRHIIKGRADYMRATYGDDFYLKPRPQKHRYIIVTGGNQKLYKLVKYKQKDYPKT